MRRSLAAASLAALALSGPAIAQPEPPTPPPGPVCTLQEIVQNCVCLLTSRVVYTATGHRLYCI